MWRPVYQQKCLTCKKNMVLIRHPRQRAVCTDCQMKSFSTPVTDPKFIKLFDINPAYYEQSSFLRDVRYQYGRFGNLSEKQISAFQRVVKELSDREKGVNPDQSSGPMRPTRVLRKGLDPFGKTCSFTMIRTPSPVANLEVPRIEVAEASPNIKTRAIKAPRKGAIKRFDTKSPSKSQTRKFLRKRVL